MKVLIAGDTHGDINHLYWLAQKAHNTGVKEIWVLGDFGYWEHTFKGKDFLDGLNDTILVKFDLTLKFIDGNHENHDMLRAYMNDENEDWKNPVQIRSRIFWLPRGYRFEIEGVKILCVGGAFSIDKDGRTEGISWWATETISYSEAVRSCQGGEVDVLLCHDAPYGGPLEEILSKTSIGYKLDEASKANRHMLKSIVDNVKPSLILHGHFHYQYSGTLPYDGGEAKIVGYGANINERHTSYGFLSLESGRWS